MADRPTTDCRQVVLDKLDDVWGQFRTRLHGLDDDEYRWAPVDAVWTVHAAPDELATVDVWATNDERDAQPAPFTTIAWRLWHIAADCLDSYSDRLMGRTGASVGDATWHWEVGPALADLDRAWHCFRHGIAEYSHDAWWAPLGDDWGPWHQHSLYDLALHAQHEVAHHGAEVALLRDLYANRS